MKLASRARSGSTTRSGWCFPVMSVVVAIFVVAAVGSGADGLDRGSEFLRTGQLEKAKAYYEDWLSKDKTSSDAVAGMGNVLIAFADFDGAMDLLEAGLESDSEHYELNLNLGWAYYYKAKDLAELGRSAVSVGSLLRDAARILQVAIDIDNERFEAYQCLGVVQQYQSEFAASAASFSTATILKPGHSYTWYLLGESLRFNEEYKRAIGAYSRAADLCDSDYYEAYRMIGLCNQWLEDEDKAADGYIKAINIAPELMPAWDDLWNLYAAQKKFKESVVAYKGILRKHPKLAYGHLVLGSVHAYDGENRRALASFKKALDFAKEPDLKSAAYYQMGITYKEIEKVREAKHALQRALKVSPEFEDPIAVLSGIAREQSESGDFRRAAEILEFLAEFKRTDGFIWSDLGLVYRDWKKYDKARSAYEKAYKYEPYDAQIINDYAVVLDYHFDAKDKAFPLYVSALEFENNVDAMQNLTRLYYEMGKFEEAIEMATEALEYDSSRAVIRQMLDDAKRSLAEAGN